MSAPLGLDFRCAISNLSRLVAYRHGGPLWSIVGSAFGLGSTSSCALCREFGFDPHADVQPDARQTVESVLGELEDEEWDELASTYGLLQSESSEGDSCLLEEGGDAVKDANRRGGRP